jgi:hypothetical protein
MVGMKCEEARDSQVFVLDESDYAGLRYAVIIGHRVAIPYCLRRILARRTLRRLVLRRARDVPAPTPVL